MKRPILIAGILLCMVSGLVILRKEKTTKIAIESTGREVNEEEEEFYEGEEHEGGRRVSGADKQLSSWFRARAYPDPFYLNEKFMNGWRQAEAIRNRQMSKEMDIQSGMWNNIGPNIGIGGRILSIAIHPTNGQILFAGSASGGMWKSTNGGTSWSAITTNLPVLGVSSIIINPSNPSIMYAGTGEVYRVDSTGGVANPGNTGFNVWKTRGTYGIGIIKSTDGGVTWTQVYNKTTDQLFGVTQMRFHPGTPTTVYACATDGLYRSTNSGSTWTRILAVTMCTDVAISGTNIMVAAGNLGNSLKGIWRSTNGGSSFSKLTHANLPATFQGFTKLAQLPSAPNTVVASIGRSSNSTVELFRTTDFGTNWTALANSGHCQWQYWFANAVAISPANANRIINGGVNTYSYTIGGSNSQIGTNIHDDIHDIQFDPSNSNNLYVCSDGGIYKSTNGGSTFTAINNGLVALQFYPSLGVSRTQTRFIGGLQDNGVVMYNGSAWSKVSWVGGDGAACAIDPNNDQVMIGSRDARAMYRSTNGGSTGAQVANYWGSVADSRTGFVAPLAFAPNIANRVYCATDNLHVSTNGGSSWSGNAYSTANNYIEAYRKTSVALGVAPTDGNTVYVSTSPFSQYDNDNDNIYVNGVPNILKTETGNTPFTIVKGAGATRLPDRYVMDIAVSKDPDSVFVVLGGFGTSHFYVSGDGGATWINKGAGLPDVPFNAVMIDPVNPKVIYAAGDLGVYVSPNRGDTWLDYNNGFPDVTLIMDLQYTSDNELLAVTHGRGIFRGPRYTSTLPVELTSFTGEAENNNNKLKWTVGNEVNVKHYELERSENGTDFTRTAIVNATGAPAYSHTDMIPRIQTYYYRLRTIDVDNSFKLSQVVQIRRNASQSLKVLSNPFRGSIDLNIQVAQKSLVRFELFDAAGKLVRKEQQQIPAGKANYSIKNLSVLPAGTYFFEAYLNNQRYKQTLVKK